LVIGSQYVRSGRKVIIGSGTAMAPSSQQVANPMMTTVFDTDPTSGGKGESGVCVVSSSYTTSIV